MASYIIYSTTTGTIRTNLTCPDDQIENHIQPGEDAIEHPGVSDALFRVDPSSRQLVEIGG